MNAEIAHHYAEYLLRYQPIFRKLGADATRVYARDQLSAISCKAIVNSDSKTTVALSDLEFDSRLFGFSMGRVDFALGEDVPAIIACFSLALERADQRGIKHLFYRAPAGAAALVGAAQACGMAVITNNLYFGREIDAVEDLEASGARMAEKGDLPALVEITRGAFSRSTRFHLDPNLPDATATLLHEIWLKNCLSGERSDVVWVVDGGDGPMGYITCSLMREVAEYGDMRAAEIGLFAVAESARGRGIGGELMRAALSWCRSKGVEWVQVDTESINVAATNFYMQSGFSFIDSWFSLHRWHCERGR